MPTPNRRFIEADIAEAVRQTLAPYPIPRQIEREVVGRVLGRLGPLLSMVDLLGSSSRDIQEILGNDVGIEVRAMHDPLIAALVNVIVDLRRRLDRQELAVTPKFPVIPDQSGVGSIVNDIVAKLNEGASDAQG